MKKFFSVHKCTYKNTFSANFDPEKWVDILKIAHLSVLGGLSKTSEIIKIDSVIFEDDSLSSLLLNKAIIADFRQRVKASHIWNKRVRFFKSNRMIYCLVDREFFICFKALGNEGIIEGMDTKRFADTMKGVDFSLNKEVHQELSRLAIKGIPPILFVGFKKDRQSISEVHFQHYCDNEVALDVVLAQGALSGGSNFKPKNNRASDSDDESVAI